MRVNVRLYGSVVPLSFLAFGIGMFLFASSWLLTGFATLQSVSAVYQLGGAGWNHVAGWSALGIFCVAMYGGLAFLLEDAKGVAILPLGRRGSAREAIEGDLVTHLQGIEDEPGVRKHL